MHRSRIARPALAALAVAGLVGAFSGTPYSITGTNTTLNCQGCGSIFINVNGDPEPSERARPWFATRPVGAASSVEHRCMV